MIDTRLNDLGKACGYAEISAEALHVIRKRVGGKGLTSEDVQCLYAMMEVVEDQAVKEAFWRLLARTDWTESDVTVATAATRDILKQSLGIVGALSRC